MALIVNDFVSCDFFTEVLELPFFFSKIDKWKLIFLMNMFDKKNPFPEKLTPQKWLAGLQKYMA
jgi:hypothetical protein